MLDFKKIKTYPIKERKNKVSVNDFILPSGNMNKTEILKDKDLKLLAGKIAYANKNNKAVIFMMGAHVIKQGLSLFIIDLMKRGIITHIAMNGAASIHDFEISLIGETSEDVAKNLENGMFGMAEETGRMMNEAINKNKKEGYGKSISRLINEKGMKFKEYSILYQAYKIGIPATVHVAIGTDIIHQHPACDGASIGEATYKDFKILTESISRLGGGVLVNIGSAVLMPEVFLKSLTIARNLGFKLDDITTANLDMIKHYRPTVNIVERPTQFGGRGFNIIEKHERTIPSLYKHILDCLGSC